MSHSPRFAIHNRGDVRMPVRISQPLEHPIHQRLAEPFHSLLFRPFIALVCDHVMPVRNRKQGSLRI